MTIDELISEKLLDELVENYGANKSDIIEIAKMILDKHADAAEDKEKFVYILTDIVSYIPTAFDGITDQVREDWIFSRIDQVYNELYPPLEDFINDDYSDGNILGL